MARIEIVAALADNLAIGYQGRMPWHLPEDLRHFKQLTLGHPVLMGRRTFESIGRPLPGRRNLVLSRSWALQVRGEASGPEVVANLDEALALAGENTLMVAGGAEVYALALPLAAVLHLTRISLKPEADTFFPDWKAYPFELAGRECGCSAKSGLRYAFETWTRSQSTGS